MAQSWQQLVTAGGYQNGYYVENEIGGLSVEIDLGDIGSPLLPTLGSPLSFNATVQDGWIEEDGLEQASLGFGNHAIYSAYARFGIEGLQDSSGNPVADTSIAVVADRSGYGPSLGTLEVSLTVGDDSLTGHFANPSPSRFGLGEGLDEQQAESGLRYFSFSDNKGGLIRFNNLQLDDYSYCQDSYWNGDMYVCTDWYQQQQSATIYYDGYRQGELVNMNGQWVVSYVDDTEALIYDETQP